MVSPAQQVLHMWTHLTLLFTLGQCRLVVTSEKKYRVQVACLPQSGSASPRKQNVHVCQLRAQTTEPCLYTAVTEHQAGKDAQHPLCERNKAVVTRKYEFKRIKPHLS